MGATTALEFVITAKDEASRIFDQVGDAAGRQSDKMKRFSQVSGAALVAVGAVAIKFGNDSIQAYQDAEESQARLADAFAKFPALADTNIGALRDLNSELQAKTGIDDDSAAAAQAVLAQFGLTGDQIAQMTPLLADYAAKTGKDLPSAAEDLGKAMLGQGRALKQVGIDFKDTGDLGGNFDQIMGGLTDKVGGFAEVAGNTASGKIQKMRVQFGELQESVGALLVPVLGKLVDIILKGVSAFNKTGNAGKIVVGIFAGLIVVLALASAAYKAQVAIQGVMLVLSGQSAAATGLQTAALVAQKIAMVAAGVATKAVAAGQWLLNAAMAANPIGLVVIAIAALVAGFIWAYNNIDWFREGVNAIWDAIVAYFKLAVEVWTAVLGAVWDFIQEVWKRSPLNWVIQNWDAIIGVFRTGVDKVKEWLGKVWDFIKTVWSYSPLGMIVEHWDAIMGFFSGLPGKVSEKVKGLWEGLKSSFKSTVNGIIDIWNKFKLTIGGGTIMGQKIPSVTLETPNIPHLATGGRVLSGGLAVVGERGPELVNLPSDSTVFSNRESMKMAGGMGGGSSDMAIIQRLDRLIEATRERASLYMPDGTALAKSTSTGQQFLAALGAAS